eukprot:4328954-Pyramimonas_sp.AAC.3
MGNEGSREKDEDDSDEEEGVVEAPDLYDALFKKDAVGKPGTIQSIFETMSCEPLLCGPNRIDKEEKVYGSDSKPDMNNWTFDIPDVDASSTKKGDSSDPLRGAKISIADDLDLLPGQGYTVEGTQDVQPLFSEPLPPVNRLYRAPSHGRSFRCLDQMDDDRARMQEEADRMRNVCVLSAEPKKRVYYDGFGSRSSSGALGFMTEEYTAESTGPPGLSKPTSSMSLYFDAKPTSQYSSPNGSAPSTPREERPPSP